MKERKEEREEKRQVFLPLLFRKKVWPSLHPTRKEAAIAVDTNDCCVGGRGDCRL
jgi:hypothetical protein